MSGWKRNLFFVWISQFLAITGFTFALPFAPFYMQELGVTDPDALKMWVALFAACAPLSLAIFSPLWGILADRYGRRPMLLRANLGAAVFLALMGSVNSVPLLIVIRCFQGMLTGTMVAAQTMVSASTPRARTGIALGTLSSGVFSGAMAGASLGGWFADAYGYRPAFFLASGILVLAALLVIFGTKESFVRPRPAGQSRRVRMGTLLSKLRAVFPMVLLIGMVSLVRRFDNPFLALLVQDIHGLEGVAKWTGALFAVAAGASLLSSVVLGHLSDRVDPTAIGRWAALLGGVLMIPQAFAGSFSVLFPARAAMAFCAAGLDPVLQAWLAKTTPEQDRGLLFGYSATVRSLFWAVGPLFAGIIATTLGLRSVFLAGSVLFVGLSFLMPSMIRRATGSRDEP